MEMQGEAQIPAPKQVVWDALNDPEALKASIAGCEELTQDGANNFAAKVRAKVGPVSARFAGKVELTDMDPPNGYRIQGEGTGGAAGFAKGGAVVRLEDDGAGGTLLKYDVNANVGGKLAQIGARLIDGAAKKMADDFFKKFSEVAAARAEEAAPAAPAPEPEPEPAAPEAEAPAEPEPAPVAAAPAPAPAAAPAAPEPAPAPAAEAPPAPAEPEAEKLEPVGTGFESRVAEDAIAEESRPLPPPANGGGAPILMWVAGVGLVVAALIYALF